MKTRRFALAAIAALSLTAVAAPTLVYSRADDLAATLAAPGRPDADKARDAARHPVELMAFAGIKPGMKVGDFIIGGGYFTRLFSAAVGPTGHVYAYTPAEFIRFNGDYQKSLDAVAALPNVSTLNGSLGAIGFPNDLDLVWTSQNYHDLHLGYMTPAQIAAVDKAIFDSLKPGGVFLVIDHYAPDGTGDSLSKKLHRIDIETVKSELKAAGFVLEGESDVLRNKDDPRTASVFDDSIKGKTDQFVLKFRKPKA